MPVVSEQEFAEATKRIFREHPERKMDARALQRRLIKLLGTPSYIKHKFKAAALLGEHTKPKPMTSVESAYKKLKICAYVMRFAHRMRLSLLQPLGYHDHHFPEFGLWRVQCKSCEELVFDLDKIAAVRCDYDQKCSLCGDELEAQRLVPDLTPLTPVAVGNCKPLVTELNTVIANFNAILREWDESECQTYKQLLGCYVAPKKAKSSGKVNIAALEENLSAAIRSRSRKDLRVHLKKAFSVGLTGSDVIDGNTLQLFLEATTNYQRASMVLGSVMDRLRKLSEMMPLDIFVFGEKSGKKIKKSSNNSELRAKQFLLQDWRRTLTQEGRGWDREWERHPENHRPDMSKATHKAVGVMDLFTTKPTPQNLIKFLWTIEALTRCVARLSAQSKLLLQVLEYRKLTVQNKDMTKRRNTLVRLEDRIRNIALDTYPSAKEISPIQKLRYMLYIAVPIGPQWLPYISYDLDLLKKDEVDLGDGTGMVKAFLNYRRKLFKVNRSWLRLLKPQHKKSDLPMTPEPYETGNWQGIGLAKGYELEIGRENPFNLTKADLVPLQKEYQEGNYKEKGISWDQFMVLTTAERSGKKSRRVLTYLNTEAQREAYHVNIKADDGGFMVDCRGVPFDTSSNSSNCAGRGFAIIAFRRDAGLFAGTHRVGKFHHSSFFAGTSVHFAGEMRVKEGRLITLTSKSGHYKPTNYELVRMLRYLAEHCNMDLTSVQAWVFDHKKKQAEKKSSGGKFKRHLRYHKYNAHDFAYKRKLPARPRAKSRKGPAVPSRKPVNAYAKHDDAKGEEWEVLADATSYDGKEVSVPCIIQKLETTTHNTSVNERAAYYDSVMAMFKNPFFGTSQEGMLQDAWVKSTYSKPADFGTINASCFLMMARPYKITGGSKDGSRSTGGSKHGSKSKGGSKHGPKSTGGSEDGLHPVAMHLLSRFPCTLLSVPKHDSYSCEKMEEALGFSPNQLPRLHRDPSSQVHYVVAGKAKLSAGSGGGRYKNVCFVHTWGCDFQTRHTIDYMHMHVPTADDEDAFERQYRDRTVEMLRLCCEAALKLKCTTIRVPAVSCETYLRALPEERQTNVKEKYFPMCVDTVEKRYPRLWIDRRFPHVMGDPSTDLLNVNDLAEDTCIVDPWDACSIIGNGGSIGESLNSLLVSGSKLANTTVLHNPYFVPELLKPSRWHYLIDQPPAVPPKPEKTNKDHKLSSSRLSKVIAANTIITEFRPVPFLRARLHHKQAKPKKFIRRTIELKGSTMTYTHGVSHKAWQLGSDTSVTTGDSPELFGVVRPDPKAENGRQLHTFKASSETEAKQWVEAIQEAIRGPPGFEPTLSRPHPTVGDWICSLAWIGHCSGLEAAIRCKVDINELNFRKQTALYCAVHEGHPAVVRFCLLNRADPNIRVSESTALHVAMFNRDRDIWKLLLEFGADPDIINGRGHTALDEMKFHSTGEFVQMFVKDQQHFKLKGVRRLWKD